LAVFDTKYKNIISKISDLIVLGVTFEYVLCKGALLNVFNTKGSPSTCIEERLRAYKNTQKNIEASLTDGRWLQIGERKPNDAGTVRIRADIIQLKQTEMRLRASE
jgi:hypothetical protein